MIRADTPTSKAEPSRMPAISGGRPEADPPIPFMSLALSDSDIESAIAVLRSGMLRQGPRCEEFESRFAAASKAQHALTCANGTCALQLAYGALLEPGDEVIVPAWTYIATASMLVACGLKPVFCDCLDGTFQIDPEDAERRITPRTTAIACTHLYGMPADVDAIQDVAGRHGLRVVYDAAQAHLARYQGSGIGAFGDAVTYSFYATKNLGTGEGGMVTCNDQTLRDRLAALRSHGETEKYLHTSIGFNYRMNDIAAAIGLSRLERLECQTDARRRVAARYDDALAEINGLDAPQRTAGAEPVWHLYTVKMDPSRFACTRDEFCEALRAEGVPTAVHYPRSLTRQPAFSSFVTDHPPVADSLAPRVFSLPIHHDLEPGQADAVCRALEKIAGAYRA